MRRKPCCGDTATVTKENDSSRCQKKVSIFYDTHTDTCTVFQSVSPRLSMQRQGSQMRMHDRVALLVGLIVACTIGFAGCTATPKPQAARLADPLSGLGPPVGKPQG